LTLPDSAAVAQSLQAKRS